MSVGSLRAFGLSTLAALCLLAGGCVNKPKSTASPLRRTASALEELAAIFGSVQDPDSAMDAVPKMKPAFDEFIDAFNSFVASGPQQGGGGMNAMAGMMAAANDLQSAQMKLLNQFERLDSTKGLPAEFWDVARMETVRMMAAMARGPGSGDAMAGPMVELEAMYNEMGPRKIVEVRLQNVAYEPEMPAIVKLRELAGPKARTIAYDNPDAVNETAVYVGPIEDFEAYVARLDFGEVTEQEAACGEITLVLPEQAPEPVAEEAPAEEAPEIDPAVLEAERLAKEQAEKAAAEQRRIAAERARLEAMLAQPERAGAAGHAQLAKLMVDKQSEHHQRAVEALAKLDPAKVADKAVRTEIARGFRTLATSPDANETSIRGLIKWGGKFSAPLLVEMVKNGQATNKQILFDGLAAHPMAEGASAVFAQLAAGTDREAAAAALSKMGPVAEDAVLAGLPAENAEVNLAAIKVLGDVGTDKGIAMLRRAAKSDNEEVKAAALEAVRKIRIRSREKK